MTKERKLAIQMWQEIKNKITDNPSISSIGIKFYKEEFCAKHNLFWNCECWFCQYMPACILCPLRSCKAHSIYHIACTSWIYKEVRLEACDMIIAALKGEYKYESR